MKTAARPINLSAFVLHQRHLIFLRYLIAVGFVLFGVLLAVSYPVFNKLNAGNNHHLYVRVESALGFGEIGCLLLVAGAIVRYINTKIRYHQRLFPRLLADNGWSYEPQLKQNEIASVLMGKGVRESYDSTYAFRGAWDKRTFSCQVFSFIEPTYEESRTRQFICLHFKLTKPFPMVVLDNRLNDRTAGFHISDLPNHIPHKVIVSLEGDFDHYYKVSTTAGQERRAVQILSPDVMLLLKEVAVDKVDIEINAQDLFLIYDAGFYTAENLTSLFRVAEVMRHELDQLSKTLLASDSKSEGTAIRREARSVRRRITGKGKTPLRRDWSPPA